jgi:ribosome biogenesis GTPase
MHGALEDLGYNTAVREAWQEYTAPESALLARVTAEHRGAYSVSTGSDTYRGTVTGKRMHGARSRADYPAVGDWVVITKAGEDAATIHDILPRTSVLAKKYSNHEDEQIIAANVDVAFVVEALDRDYNLNRFERYFVLAQDGGVTPVAILNKTDLLPRDKLDAAVAAFAERFPDILLVCTNTTTGDGASALRDSIAPGHTYCFLGSSGVGKSSLINTLLGDTSVAVGEIGAHAGRGKHTTTVREMYVLDGGGVVIDNPGTREVGIADATSGIDDVFEHISALGGACKFGDCTHTQEPGCAVLQALEDGTLLQDQYQHYLRLTRESDHYAMNATEKRHKDRAFGKMVKTAKKDSKALRHRDWE